MNFFKAHPRLREAIRYRETFLAATVQGGGLFAFPLRISSIEGDRLISDAYGSRSLAAGSSIVFEVASPALAVWVLRAWVLEPLEHSEGVGRYVLEPVAIELEKLLEPRAVSMEVAKVRSARRLVTPDPQKSERVMDSYTMEKFNRLYADKAIAYVAGREPVVVPAPSLFCASSDSLVLGIDLFRRETAELYDGERVWAGALLEGEAHIACGVFQKVLSPFGRFGLISVDSVESLRL